MSYDCWTTISRIDPEFFVIDCDMCGRVDTAIDYEDAVEIAREHKIEMALQMEDTLLLLDIDGVCSPLPPEVPGTYAFRGQALDYRNGAV